MYNNAYFLKIGIYLPQRTKLTIEGKLIFSKGGGGSGFLKQIYIMHLCVCIYNLILSMTYHCFVAGVHPRAVYDLDWSSQGYIVTAGGDDAIRIFRSETKIKFYLGSLHSFYIHTLLVYPFVSNTHQNG